jgi:multidrug resistance efflux pump
MKPPISLGEKALTMVGYYDAGEPAEPLRDSGPATALATPPTGSQTLLVRGPRPRRRTAWLVGIAVPALTLVTRASGISTAVRPAPVSPVATTSPTRPPSTRLVRVYPRVGGIVTRVAVEEGQPIRAGSVLVTLDMSDLERQLEVRTAELEACEAELRLARRAAGKARAAAISTAEARLEDAQVAHEAASARIHHASIVAPFDGWVVARLVHPGEAVAPSTRGQPAETNQPPLLILASR